MLLCYEKEVEKLLGHASFVALLRRESLAVFASAYAFIRSRYAKRCILWPSVARELTLSANLLPPIFQDMRAGWSEDVIATDASEWGLGAVIGRFDGDVVRRCGKLNERWRFRLGLCFPGRTGAGRDRDSRRRFAWSLSGRAVRDWQEQGSCGDLGGGAKRALMDCVDVVQSWGDVTAW